MTRIHYQEIMKKASDFLAMTSLTPDEFDELIPAFEQAFQQRMEEYCLDGKPRLGRDYVSYANSPLPTPEARLFFYFSFHQNASHSSGTRSDVWLAPK